MPSLIDRNRLQLLSTLWLVCLLGVSCSKPQPDLMLEVISASNIQRLNLLREINFADQDEYGQVAFSPDGTTLAIVSGFLDSSVRLVDVSSGEVQNALSSSSLSLTDVKFSPDGRLVVGLSYELIVWDAESGNVEYRLSAGGSGGSVMGISFSPDGKLLATTGYLSGILQLWNLNTGQVIRQTTLDSKLLSSDAVESDIAFSSDGASLIAVTRGAVLSQWNLADGALLREVPICSVADGVNMALSPIGDVLAVTCYSDIGMYDANTWQQLYSIKSSQAGATTKLSFSNYGDVLATGSGKVEFWAVQDGQLLRTLNTQSLGMVTFSPDGHILAVVDMKGTVQLWGVITDTRPVQ